MFNLDLLELRDTIPKDPTFRIYLNSFLLKFVNFYVILVDVNFNRISEKL
jgi:hypothetical protein